MGLYDEDGKNSEPYSIEAEEALLGSVFINPNVIGDVVDIITAEDFYKNNYKLIFSEMINAYNSGKIIDVLLIIESLKKKELMDEVGDEEVIYDLTEVVPTAAKPQGRSLQKKTSSGFLNTYAFLLPILRRNISA